MKILFISHDAYRAGAQLLLLHFLQWLRNNRSDIDFDVLLGNGGELESEFASVANVYVYSRLNHKFNIVSKYRIKSLTQTFQKNNYDIIYCNSIVNGAILNDLSALSIPIITHVHELDYWINKAGTDNLQHIKRFTTQFIVASNAVSSCLVDRFDILNEQITTIYEFTQIDKLEALKASIMAKLKLPKNSIIVGASGAENWRKGKDWFIPLAIDVLSRGIEKNIHFVWIGGDLNYELKNDLEKSGISDKIHFISHLPNANQYFHEFAVFAMLSREDPFPVVNLEAAGLGVPIVCFEKAGGTPELVGEGCGFAVPYANINAFADKICLLIENKSLRDEISVKSIENIKQNYDIDIIARKLVDVIFEVK
ncbi:MAG: glycosyltransferase family 4 protein [Bacteroidales bacterium]